MTGRERKYIATNNRDKTIRRLLIKKRVLLGVNYQLHYLMHEHWFIINNSWKRPGATPVFSVMDARPRSQQNNSWINPKPKQKNRYI